MLEFLRDFLDGSWWISGLELSRWWIAGTLVYGGIGLVVIRPTGGLQSRVMSALGWPIELMQRLRGARGLPYLFLLPNMLVFGLFTFAPLFVSVGFAFTDGMSINFEDRRFSGLDNAQRLLLSTNIDTGGINPQADAFRGAVVDTIWFSLLQVPLMVLIALATALVLNRDIAGRAFWRAVFFYPVMLSPVVVGFLWALVLDRQGVLSQLLVSWGWIDAPIQWLQEGFWPLFWTVFIYTWAHLGFYMLILLAGLQAIPNDLYEAAEMDAASPFRTLWRVTLPLLMPTLLVVFILALIKAVQAFEEILALQVNIDTVVEFIYFNGGFRGTATPTGRGVAALASLLVGGGLMLLSLLQIALSRRQASP